MMYKYFISFHHSGRGRSGLGNTEVTIDFKIGGIKDIQEIGKRIATELDIDNVVIINYQLFDK